MTAFVEMVLPRDASPGLRLCSAVWAEGLREAGLDVTSADVADVSESATAVIVSPHAALLPVADDLLRVAGILRHSVCVSTSRFASGRLGADRPFHEAAQGSVSLSRDSTRYLSGHGISTAHFKPGSHRLLRSSANGERSVAVGVHARYSSFREDVLARSRTVLDAYECDLRISRSPQAHPPGHLEADRWLAWLTSLDVIVSLPSEAGPGTHWCEVAPAIMNRAVVLTTAESDFGGLEPGDHLVITTAERFPDSLRRLLDDDERRERIRASAFDQLMQSPLDVAPLAHVIQMAMVGPRRSRPFVVPPMVTREEPNEAPPDIPAALAAAEAARSRRVSARTGGIDGVTTTSGWDAVRSPVLSVVITCFDQAAFVAEAVKSALAVREVELEVVVIDDRSADESASVVRALLAAHDDRAVKFVEHADNAGVSGARNRGFRESRAPSVLLLDADDTVLPNAPAALHRALECNPDAAFSYGMIARFGLGRESLMGTSPWDPELFRRGNYIPVSCSLLRRSAWELMGGYTAEGLLELGWEDMDLWLRLAAAGRRGVQVRRIVGTYRAHPGSMIAVTNAHAAALRGFMEQRHTVLMGADGV